MNEKSAAENQTACLAINMGGKRTYKKYGPIEVIKDLMTAVDYKPPSLKVQVRGKDMTFLIEGAFMVWTAVFLEEIEPEQLDWIDAMPKDSVLYDLGASTGPYTVYAALSDLRLFAFEPEAQNFAVLEMQHYLNHEKIKYPITSFNLAVSDKPSLDHMYCANYRKGAHQKILGQAKNVLAADGEFATQHKQTIIADSLDNIIRNFNLPVPNYIKIDVDGAETKVIEGAKNTLKSLELKEIFIELTEDESGAKLREIIESYGFKCRMKTAVEDHDGLSNLIFSRI